MTRSYAALFIFLFASAVYSKECEKKQCKGPIRYYEDLNCKPIYEKPGDCCAVRYDCPHFDEVSSDKCYLNGHEYKNDEKIRDEDIRSACEKHCACKKYGDEPAKFVCPIVDCPYEVFVRVPPGCHIKSRPDSCCGFKVCRTYSDPEDGLTCEFNGTIYKDGQMFYPDDQPHTVCYCMEGYKGKNIAPFCQKINCATEIHHSRDLRENCIPVFYNTQNPKTDCAVTFRCQNKRDAIKNQEIKDNDEGTTKEPPPQNMKCKFGNMTVPIGDELEPTTDYSSVCVKCVCEVPPTLTCQHLPDSECDITKHPKFDNSDSYSMESGSMESDSM